MVTKKRPKTAELEPQHQTQFSGHIQDTHWRSLIPLQWSSRRILQPQSIGQDWLKFDHDKMDRKIVIKKLEEFL